jgi:hypothetical protein
LNDAEQILEQAFLVVGVLVIELCQVFPNHLLPLLHAKRVGDPSVFPPEPAGMIADQFGVKGAMADHQVHHQLQAQCASLLRHALEFGRRFGRAGSVHEERVQSEIIFDRVKAPGISGVLDGIDEDPVETHLRRADQVRLPIPDVSRE